jgi:hypothetical protein
LVPQVRASRRDISPNLVKAGLLPIITFKSLKLIITRRKKCQLN